MSDARSALLWLVYLLPLGYVAGILAVGTHEVVGHWGAALLTDMEPARLRVSVDGSGRLDVGGLISFDAESAEIVVPEIPITILAGGVVAALAIGLLLLPVARRLRRRRLLGRGGQRYRRILRRFL